MERVAHRRTAGLDLLRSSTKTSLQKRTSRRQYRPFLYPPSKGDMNHFEVPRRPVKSAASPKRKKVEVRFLGRMDTGNSSDFLIEVVVPDLSRASLVNCCQLDQIDWGS